MKDPLCVYTLSAIGFRPARLWKDIGIEREWESSLYELADHRSTTKVRSGGGASIAS
jgi:hypothetical protein